VAPGFTLLDGHTYPVSVSFPVTLGLGLDDYYEAADSAGQVTSDDTFGFVDAGVVAGVPLAAIPQEYGSWEATAGVHFLTLGGNLQSANAGDPFEVLGLFGISLSY